MDQQCNAKIKHWAISNVQTVRPWL